MVPGERQARHTVAAANCTVERFPPRAQPTSSVSAAHRTVFHFTSSAMQPSRTELRPAPHPLRSTLRYLRSDIVLDPTQPKLQHLKSFFPPGVTDPLTHRDRPSGSSDSTTAGGSGEVVSGAPGALGTPVTVFRGASAAATAAADRFSDSVFSSRSPANRPAASA